MTTTNRLGSLFNSSSGLPTLTNTYGVKPGDTLSAIAKSHGLPLETLLKANPQIKDPDVIHAGQQVVIPEHQASASPSGTRNTTAGGKPAASTYSSTRLEPPPLTARPTGKEDAAPPADPKAAAQLQEQMRKANLGTRLKDVAVKDIGDDEGRGGKFAGLPGGSNAIRNQKSGVTTRSDVSVDTRGVTERNSARTDLGGKNGVTMTQEQQTLRATDGRSRDFKGTTLTDAKGNKLSETEEKKRSASGRSVEMAGTSRTTVAEGKIHEKSTRMGTGWSSGGKVESYSETNTVTSGGTKSGQKTSLNSRDGGRTTENVTTVHQDGQTRAKNLVRENAEASATIASVEKRSDWVGAVTKHGGAQNKDATGARGEVHVLAAQGQMSASAGVNVKELKVAAGGQIGGAVDLIGASGSAQLGRANSVAGAGILKGEAHVGARANVGGGLEIDPRKGTAKVGLGGEAFAGAEIKGSVGYQNRYVGAEVEARGQAGAGVAARAEVGFDKGVFKAKADLGACVGLGGRVTVNVNVNVGAMVSDAKQAVGGAVSSGWNAAKSWVKSFW